MPFIFKLMNHGWIRIHTVFFINGLSENIPQRFVLSGYFHVEIYAYPVVAVT